MCWPSAACTCQLKCGTGSVTDGNSFQGGNLFAVSAHIGCHGCVSDPFVKLAILPLLQRAAWTAKDLKLKLQMCHGRCPHQRWQQYLRRAAWSAAHFVKTTRTKVGSGQLSCNVFQHRQRHIGRDNVLHASSQVRADRRPSNRCHEGATTAACHRAGPASRLQHRGGGPCQDQLQPQKGVQRRAQRLQILSGLCQRTTNRAQLESLLEAESELKARLRCADCL